MLSDGSRWSLTESKRAHRNNQKPSGKPKLRQLQDNGVCLVITVMKRNSSFQARMT